MISAAGPLCAVCGDGEYAGRYHVALGSECRKCTSRISAIMTICLWVVLLIVGLIGMFNSDPARQTAIFKIIVSFCQVRKQHANHTGRTENMPCDEPITRGEGRVRLGERHDLDDPTVELRREPRNATRTVTTTLRTT